MYEDMIETMAGNKHCNPCEKVTRHTLVELVMKDDLNYIIETIDSWWQCQICDNTSATPHTGADFPF